MTSSDQLNWDIKDHADQVARATVDVIVDAAARAIAERGCFRLVLAGGSTPRTAYEQLAQLPLDWSNWYFYYGDERCLPVDHEERNSVMARHAWLNKIQLDQSRHFPIPAELGAEDGAEKYRQTIADIEAFDLLLLGMGEDGHTASLFPNQLWQPDAEVIPVYDAPKPPPQRISLGPAVIHRARQRCFIITGAGKADAIAEWKNNGDLPISRAALPGDRVIIDKSAWGEDRDRL